MSLSGTFRSLSIHNYRIFFWGGLSSNIGLWMQRTAQSWVVLLLTDGDGFALGTATFLQFFPTVLLSAWAGSIIDRVDKVRMLVLTQTLVGIGSLIMGVLDLSGVINLAQVYSVVIAIGVVTAFDAPARQSFVSELVDRDNIVNAIGLNTASFNVARLIGPAAAGLIIGSANTAVLFFLHAVSSASIVTALLLLDRSRLLGPPPQPKARGRVIAGLRYIGHDPALVVLIALAAVISSVGANSLQVVLPLVATEYFDVGAVGFGVLTSCLAVGGLAGALLASSTSGIPRRRWMLGTALLFGVSQLVASMMPVFVAFAVALAFCGVLFMAFVVAVNTSVQLTSSTEMRGRVVAVYMMFFLGGGALGAPLLGVLCEQIGPMGSIACAGIVSIAACSFGVLALLRVRRGGARQELARLS
jgi:MFS family permease